MYLFEFVYAGDKTELVAFKMMNEAESLVGHYIKWKNIKIR